MSGPNPSAFPGLPLSGGTLSGPLTVAGAISTTGLANINASGNLTSALGVLDLQSVGKGLQVKEGTNAKQGQAVLVAGTVVVSDTAVTATSGIVLGQRTPGGTPGALFVSAVTVGTGFTITSTNAADTSTAFYEIFEQG